VDCKAESQTLSIAQLERNEAQLRELMQSEKALYEIERCITNLYNWSHYLHALLNMSTTFKCNAGKMWLSY
jgi:hypothetical protein